ncbi:hypothetical protein GJ496_001575, partial [Pomphorhynchus laevis]
SIVPSAKSAESATITIITTIINADTNQPSNFSSVDSYVLNEAARATDDWTLSRHADDDDPELSLEHNDHHRVSAKLEDLNVISTVSVLFSTDIFAMETTLTLDSLCFKHQPASPKTLIISHACPKPDVCSLSELPKESQVSQMDHATA